MDNPEINQSDIQRYIDRRFQSILDEAVKQYTDDQARHAAAEIAELERLYEL